MAKTNFVLRQGSKNNEFNVYLRVSHLSYPARYISLHTKTKQNQWDKENQRFRRSKPNYKRLNESLDEIAIKAENIISNLMLNNNFTIDVFRKYFLKKDDALELTNKEFFLRKISELKCVKRFGSFKTYSNAYSALTKYASIDIPFSDIDFRFLKGFELYQIQLGNKPNSYSDYFRILRALHYEHCKLNNKSQPNIYRRFNLSRLKNETNKRSLTKEQLRKLIKFEPISEAQSKAKLLFLFSFYSRGTNLMDLLQFTHDNLEGDVLIYRRQKTGKFMQIKLIRAALLILKYFENASPYLFPYLRKGDIPRFRIDGVNRNINRRLKSIGIDNLTMYYARHTFAELNYKAGVRIEIISQMLGHSDLKTTQVYLRSFSDDEVDDAAETIFNSL